MSRRIPTTGASVAGNTLAAWSCGADFDGVIVEQAPGFRDGGQTIDMRGVGRAVVRRTDLEQAVSKADGSHPIPQDPSRALRAA